jgi:hypothetical protein
MTGSAAIWKKPKVPSWLSEVETSGEAWIVKDGSEYEWASLAQARPAILTHCPNNSEFISRCHELGVRCFPYITCWWGADQVAGSDTNHPASDVYQGINFAKHAYYWCIDAAGNLYKAQKDTPNNGGGYPDGVGFKLLPTGCWTCPNAVGYVDAMVNWVEHLMSLGADGVFVDNFTNRGDNACFGASETLIPDNRHHPHRILDANPDAPSPAVAEKAQLTLFSRVRDAVKKNRPDGLVIGNTWAYEASDFDAPNRLSGLPAAYWKLVDIGMIESYFYPRVDRFDNGMPKTPLSDDAWAKQWGVWHDFGGPNSPPEFASRRLPIVASVDTAQRICMNRYNNPSPSKVIGDLTDEREYAFLTYATARLSGFIWNASSALSNSAVADLYRLRLGPPLTAEINLGGANGLYFRVFRRGLVAVNLDLNAKVALPPKAYAQAFQGSSIPTPKWLVDVFNAGAPGRAFQRDEGSDWTATYDADTLSVPRLSGRVYLFGSDLTYQSDFQQIS